MSTEQELKAANLRANRIALLEHARAAKRANEENRKTDGPSEVRLVLRLSLEEWEVLVEALVADGSLRRREEAHVRRRVGKFLKESALKRARRIG